MLGFAKVALSVRCSNKELQLQKEYSNTQSSSNNRVSNSVSSTLYASKRVTGIIHQPLELYSVVKPHMVPNKRYYASFIKIRKGTKKGTPKKYLSGI